MAGMSSHSFVLSISQPSIDTLSFLVLVKNVLVPIEVAKNKHIASIFDLAKERDRQVGEYFKELMARDCQYFCSKPPVPLSAFLLEDEVIVTNKAQVLQTYATVPVSTIHTVEKAFQSGVLSGAVCLLIEATHALRTGKKRRLEVEDSDADRPGFDEAQAQDVEIARTAIPPSSAAAIPAFLKEQEKRPVLNGRPCNNYGPPIGLFHPIFDSFQAAMKVTQMPRLMCDRISAIGKYLDTLLGDTFMTIEASGVKSDGVMTLSAAFLVVCPIENTGQGKSDIVRSKSYCPSFILAIAGPWLCVLGGIYADKAIVQPLTDYLWLGGDIFSDDRLLSISRLFAALKSAISTLRQYYWSLSDVAGDSPNGFPFVRNYLTETFSYMTPLAEDHPHKLIYKAKHERSRQPLVVKFVSTYCAQAHRLLAEHQLAPTLHYAGTEDAGAQTYGGRYMIVMDFVDTAPSLDSLSEGQIGQVRRAVDLLHSHNIVFGDLRRPNILITAEKGNVMVIDFDWCNQAGEGLYPASLNQDGDIDWSEGVGPSCVMMKQHDLDVLKKLS
ncbi:hypothetical protein M0805_006186 [Coniferiporia weirii]|nr:hypothetical protein M0805_006186 [Coniferiporia weirii]